MDGTVLAAAVTVAGSLAAASFAQLGRRRTERLASGKATAELGLAGEAQRHTELRDIIDEMREEVDRARNDTKTAREEAAAAMLKTRECEEREADMRRERNRDRTHMAHMAARLSRLDGGIIPNFDTDDE